MTIQMIPFNKLVSSSLNMRIKASSKKDDDQLYANIKAEGILKNLLVVPTEDEKAFEVIGGGRRLRMGTRLVDDGFWTAEQPIPCRVCSRDKAKQLTIAENLHAATHPADDYNAYKALADDGLSVKDIAEIFGHSTKQVEKLMRLGRVHPTLLQLFRDDKLNLDCVIAFAVCDDQERQLSCWAEVKRGYVSASAIRNFLTKNTYASKDGIVKFITLAAYKKAGGTVTRDLFQDTTYLNDVELVERLAAEKLALSVESLNGEGWLWVDSSITGFYSHDSNIKRIYAALVGVPESLETEISELESRIEELNYSDEDLTDDEEAELEAKSTKLDELEGQRDEYLAFTPEQKAFSGVVVSFEDSGAIKINRGVVRKSEWPLLKAASAVEGGSSASHSAEPQGIESNALRQDLNTYHMQAFRAGLVANPALCMDIFIFDMACSTLQDYSERLIAVSMSPSYLDAVGIADTAAFSVLEAGRAALSLDWLEIDDSAEQFSEFLRLSGEEKNAILCYCVAVSANASVKRPCVQQEYASQQMNFNLLTFWKPTAENYFSRINKAALLDIGGNRLGEEWLKSSASKKRSELSLELAASPALSDWVPASLSSLYGEAGD